jgi:hypothetical protein
MYWVIVNNRGEALAAFSAFIPKFSSVCTSGLRLACMFTSNHALFMQLNLGRVINRKCMALMPTQERTDLMFFFSQGRFFETLFALSTRRG